MKITKILTIAVIMAVLTVGTASARAPYTPETATEVFVNAAIAGNIPQMTWSMTEDSAALLVLYADPNKIRNFFSNKGGIARIEQVSNDGNIAITRVTFRDGSTEQFRLYRGNYEWYLSSQILRRN